MNEIRLDTESFRYFSAFEKLTRTKALDCYVADNRVVYVVEEGSLGEAIGKGGSRLNRLKSILNRPVDIVEHSPQPEKFVSNIFHRFKINRAEITERGDRRVCIIWVRPQDKGMVIGKGGRNLKLARELAKRHHDLDDVIISSGM